MKLQVVRTQFGLDATNGLLFIDGKFECFTLEDQYQAVKVAAETAIPEGTYKITLRTVGGFHSKYLKRYSFHKGMLWVRDVPGFEYILIHTGNTDEHTAGCLILGNTQTNNRIAKDGFIGSSVDAYKFVYPRVAAAIEAGLDVEVTYIDYDGDIQESTQEPVKDDIMEKLQEISGEVQILSAKLDGRNIV